MNDLLMSFLSTMIIVFFCKAVFKAIHLGKADDHWELQDTDRPTFVLFLLGDILCLIIAIILFVHCMPSTT